MYSSGQEGREGQQPGQASEAAASGLRYDSLAAYGQAGVSNGVRLGSLNAVGSGDRGEDICRNRPFGRGAGREWE